MNQNENKQPSVLFRWTVLALVSLVIFGNYYIYDSISPLADLLEEQLGFSDADIGLLNGIYSLPNIIMVLIGGIIIDKIGTRISTLLFAFICLLGASITASSSELMVMGAGRLVFGLGAESLIVAVTTVIGRWFKGKQLSFAFALNLTIARLGTFAALNSPTWGRDYYDNWQDPLMLAVFVGVFSLAAAALYFGMDKYAENTYSLQGFEKQDEIKIKEIFNFGKSFWFITLLCVTFYSAIFPFQTFAVKFFIEEHFLNLDEDVARSMGAFLSSLLILSAMILMPIFGFIVDRIGKRATLMMAGSLVLLPVYLMLEYYQVTPVIPAEVKSELHNLENYEAGDIFAKISGDFLYFLGFIKVLVVYYPNLIITMAVMGFSFSLIPAVMWPSVAIIVDIKKLGTALGLMTMVQNVGLALFNIGIGQLNDITGSYEAGLWVFSSLGLFGFVFSWFLKKSDALDPEHPLEKGRIK